MPKQYEAIRDECAAGAKKDSPKYNACQTNAAKIYNARRKKQPGLPKLSNKRGGK